VSQAGLESEFLHEHLAQASPDLLRELMGGSINTLHSADADSVCGAFYGVRDEGRTNRRNGYRHRDLDTRIGTLDVAVPSCVRAPTSPTGSSSAVAGPSQQRGRDLQSARGLHPADGPVGAVPGDHRLV